jgi:Lrp/AsnC family leucine-responsive transcriptional regulator
MNYLVSHPKIVWAVYFDGDLDAAFVTWSNNIREFEEVYDDVNRSFGMYLQEKYFSIATRIDYLRYKFLNNRNDTSSLVFGDCYGHYKLDDLDRKILNDLNRNGRMTLVELANKYNSSAKVIKTRIDRLIKNEIIIGFNVKINHILLGYSHRKVLLKLNDISKEKKLSAYLKNHKNVIYLVKTIGDYDFEFELMTESNEQFHNIIRELRSVFAEDIKEYTTVIHHAEPKSGQFYNF